MNIALEHLARQLDLDAPHHETLRLAFGLACTRRVEHLLEASQAVDCLAILGRYLDGACDREQLAQAAAIASRLANHHPGSTSIDGCGHGAISDPASFDIEHAWQVACLERCALPA